MLKKGDKIPEDIELRDDQGNLRKIGDFKGKRTIYYTYPKDFTGGCTTEAKNFRDAIQLYEGADIQIIGISADSVDSHRRFKEKYNLPFILLSDPDKVFLNKLGSIVGGKIKRRTWLVDENGVVEKMFEKVSPSKHNDELCEYYLLKKE